MRRESRKIKYTASVVIQYEERERCEHLKCEVQTEVIALLTQHLQGGGPLLNSAQRALSPPKLFS